MKRVIEGRAFNTDTATEIARSEVHLERRNGSGRGASVLYQTRAGDFFIAWTQTTPRMDRVGEVTASGIEPMTPEAAREWAKRLGGNLDDLLAKATEIARNASCATFYIRVPALLKAKAEARASAEGLSLNSWMLRCVERIFRD